MAKQEEKPVGPPATIEERRAAQTAGEDIFDEGTTDNTAAGLASPEDVEAARVAEEELEKARTGEETIVPPERKADLADALNNLAASLPGKQVPTPEPEKQLTPEELDAMLNKYEISDELLAELDNTDTRKSALRKIVAGAAKEGATAASILAGTELQNIRQQLKPLLEQQAENHRIAQHKAFVAEYPALEDEAYEPILNIVAQELRDEKVQPKTVVEARKILAERAAVYIKSIKPDFDLKAKGTQKTTTKTTIPRPASVATKAPSGGAGGPKKETTGEPNRSPGVEVFD